MKKRTARTVAQAIEREREHDVREHARRMESLEKQKSEFLLVASHELRGPLSVLAGYISLMQEGALGELPERARDALQTMSERANVMARLIEELLQTARMEHGLELELKPLDLRDVTNEAAKSMMPAAAAHNQRIEVHVTADPAPIVGDRDRLVIILNGLLDNAIKYSAPQAPISCDVSTEPDWALVAVRDGGIGIKPEDLPKLFTRFGRLPNSDNAHIPGAGLGLYLAQNLARMHGGRITVESEPGNGSTFVLRLPISHKNRPS